jgi:regulatory protein
VILLDKVYRYLALRPRSEKEIIDYLKKKRASFKERQKILTLLKQQDLIDDIAFTDWWLDQRSSFRPKGRIALKMELRKKGIAQEIIEKKLTEIDELTLARKAIQKKSRDPQKITTFLKYRGFSWPTIKSVLAELFGKL